ncbi:hypothetical protein BVG16_15040 [Paenibacillus selenitireducens]|uniref:Haloacid dehalogenase n=1 Tax=Paenibacillus selenitireducens TaxID=1324314 RepID=A0A1T2XCV7_9BACL|nr:HAD-IA family hydrolase [Paenibacillus selenitireducens]OPA77747.1 hypothetical protein BVG16_15040 [Paenibacillus selenitireducens]
MKKVLFWDFDGTLGGRIDGLYGRAWSASMWEALQMMNLHEKTTVEDILAHLEQGFPWQEPEIPHLHLHTPALWWEHICKIFQKIYISLGYSPELAVTLSAIAKDKYVDLSRWELYPDTMPVLRELAAEGWTHYIVSNHVPELRVIVEHLGLKPLIEDVINSAEVGYEKPNQEIFRIALRQAGEPEQVWMIGDNIVADVLGAQSVGIPSILVRHSDPRAAHQFQDFYGVLTFLRDSIHK